MTGKTRLFDRVYAALESNQLSVLESTLDDIRNGHPVFKLDLSSPYKDMTMLHVAVGFSENDPASVHMLISHPLCKNVNANILNWTEERISPLHLAILNDYDKVAELLLRHGGDPKIKTGDGKSSFHLCVEKMSEELMENCFSLFCRKYLKFRQSVGGLSSLSHSKNNSSRFSVSSSKMISSKKKGPFFEDSPEDISNSNGFSSASLASKLDALIIEEELEEDVSKCNSVLVEESPVKPTKSIYENKENLSITHVTGTTGTSIGNGTNPSNNNEFFSLDTASSSIDSPTGNGTSTFEELSKPKDISSNIGSISEESSAFKMDVKPNCNNILIHKNYQCTYSMLMTEDESDQNLVPSLTSSAHTSPEDCSKLNTILEERSDFFHELHSSTSNASTLSSVKLPPTKKQIETLKNTNLLPEIKIPVTKTTYGILSKIAKSPEKQESIVQKTVSKGPIFSDELLSSLRNLNIIQEWGNLQIEILQSTCNSPKSSKKTASKSFFNYLLLDPKIIRRANFSGNFLKSDSIIKNVDKYKTFLKGIFYIGKGCGKRPLQHLLDAKEIYAQKKLKSKVDKTSEPGEKMSRILDIWGAGMGVIVLQVFPYSSEWESNVNEAAMIDAMGLKELCNMIKGSYAGSVVQSWSQKKKNQYGSFLLYRSFCNFAMSDQKLFFPEDV